MNIRFTDWFHGSEVKLTLRPGQPLTHAYGGGTEEGYHVTTTHYYRWKDGHEVFRDTYTESRDCDGRMDTHRTDKLVDGQWERVRAGQRDYQAEAAGY